MLFNRDIKLPTLMGSAMHEGYVKFEGLGTRIIFLPSSRCSRGVNRSVNNEKRPTPLRESNELANFAPVPATGCPLQKLLTNVSRNCLVSWKIKGSVRLIG